MAVLPMFPLGTVLLPGEVLPLQVFEPRYHALVRDCLSAPVPEFGIVMIERGSEVGGGDQRAMVGTVARIAQLREMPGDRLAVAVFGLRRVRVERWLDDDPYPRAEVVNWPDALVDLGDLGGAGPKGDVAACHAHAARVLALASELGLPTSADIRLADDPMVASYQLAAAVPLGPADRHRLLCAAGPDERLVLLASALDDLEAMLRFQLGSAES